MCIIGQRALLGKSIENRKKNKRIDWLYLKVSVLMYMVRVIFLMVVIYLNQSHGQTIFVVTLVQRRSLDFHQLMGFEKMRFNIKQVKKKAMLLYSSVKLQTAKERTADSKTSIQMTCKCGKSHLAKESAAVSNEMVILLEYMDMGSVCNSCFLQKSRTCIEYVTSEEMKRSGHKQITLDHLTVEQLRFIHCSTSAILELFHLHNPASSTKPLVHRDIKPRKNTLLSCNANGDVKIADFGLLYINCNLHKICARIWMG
ncbi:hypothetical protein RFI_33992 [Reticulomyxa filosa]|uniref:Protein kinase domain-containing protein n=1 Tax=Reticulomyxa filosa TaxID=46433 RepID=X6LND4_RETFI|nr:hypothetical protein RFI_33992 [Reticulomyxa filosa]|eukprot:ETO03418.1 hypothetical protein RFI_33992 [Reticulomyxa filosa]